ncbi:MAG: RNA polymerase sigma factor [Bacteroidota bacterium]
MKVIAFYSSEKQLINRAKAGQRAAQQAIYDRFAPKMLSVCRQYIKDIQFAEDVMVNGFVKVFKGLNTFENRGSFEGWIRRIMTRECISYLRKRQFVVYDDEMVTAKGVAEHAEGSFMEVEYLQKMIDALPEGYKMVFVLYAIEGYKHQEIAKMLEISEGTSKSQLFKARKLLQENLKFEKTTSPKKMG